MLHLAAPEQAPDWIAGNPTKGLHVTCSDHSRHGVITIYKMTHVCFLGFHEHQAQIIKVCTPVE